LPQQNSQAEIRRLSVEAENAMAAKDLPAATAALEKLSNLTPNSAQVHANLGLVYYMQNRYSQAIGAFQKAAKIDSGLPNVNVMLGICLTETGRYNDAVKLLGPAFRSSSAKDSMGRVAGLALARAQPQVPDLEQGMRTTIKKDEEQGKASVKSPRRGVAPKLFPALALICNITFTSESN
jgi:predicted Zn-dependent protease